MANNTGDIDTAISEMINLYKQHVTQTEANMKGKKREDVSENISIGEWKRSLRYDEHDREQLLKKLLIEFDIEPSEKNEKRVKNNISNLISVYEDNYNLHLEPMMRIMLIGLLMRITYDRLAVKHLL